MQTKLTWRKNYFSNLYSIYSNGQQIGKLKDKTFSQIANGELNGKEYTFKTKGFFKQHTEIIDNSENKVIGEIIYNNWMHILDQNGHSFLIKADSNSCAKRTAIPAESGHGFLLKTDSRPL